LTKCGTQIQILTQPRKHDKHKSEISIKRGNIILKTTKFMSNVLEAISKLKLKTAKITFLFYLPAYSYIGI